METALVAWMLTCLRLVPFSRVSLTLDLAVPLACWEGRCHRMTALHLHGALVQQMQDTTTNNYITSLRRTISSSDRVRCIKQPVESEEPLVILVLCRHRTTNNYSASPRQTISSSDRVRCIKQPVEREEPLVILVLCRHIIFEYKKWGKWENYSKTVHTWRCIDYYPKYEFPYRCCIIYYPFRIYLVLRGSPRSFETVPRQRYGGLAPQQHLWR